MPRPLQHRRLLRAAVVCATAALTFSAAGAAGAAEPTWTETGTSYVNSLTGSQGLASRADGSLLHRGLASVPLSLRVAGWSHVGDPDIARGYTFDAYQGGDTATKKMYAVTAPDGSRTTYEHALDQGELLNNSFASVSPDAQWLVSGEWGTMNRLQVFPAPVLNPAAPASGANLPQAGQISLDRPVENIQGCDFVTGTRLLCASDDAAKEVLQVDLARPLDGKPVTGQVSTAFRIPQRSVCSGSFEAEGIDYDTTRGTLRVEIVPPSPCLVTTAVISYTMK
ncbi:MULTISPECIES: hypothetical protein [unclassified Streptomyces]|uniref:hypothetical protein n=1 Tax=unclassified Streptomyces TaxID=2593676 RepID=UPI000DB9609D|nr:MULTISPECIES: hypothetical protein [unclassified Streptomyces]MYT74450.1 hypothetical protein [Streptomyces sp. SID8367]RAJ91428.1 hypothetical protein K377_00193 [Streptomyces sp. PsTaAH-137]